jgi:hypothetical protein
MTRKVVYKVGKGKSLMAKGDLHLKPGDVAVPGVHFAESEIKPMLRDGFLVQKGGKAQDDEDEEDTPVPSEITTDAKKPNEDPLSIGGGANEAKVRADAAKTTQAVKAAQKNPPLSQWVMNPEGLAKKSLDALNVMIKERDQSAATQTDRDAAIKFLSRDFKG